MMMRRMRTKRVRRKGSRYRARDRVIGESEAEVTDSIYYKGSYWTHPAAPVMMAFLPFKRSPRFVLGMMEKKRMESQCVLDIAVG